MVYPSATHTRFQHSLGAMHLTSEAVKELRLKGHNISDDEEKAVMAAILLHDIGHCPYSHVLENIIVGNIRHERISDILMQQISDEMEDSSIRQYVFSATNIRNTSYTNLLAVNSIWTGSIIL